jgi:hypothetical protein
MVMDCLVTDVLVPEQLYSMLTWTVATLGQDKQAEPKLDMSEQITDGSTRQGWRHPARDNINTVREEKIIETTKVNSKKEKVTCYE